MPSLMDRVYCNNFLERTKPQQVCMIEKIRAMRTSALTAAQLKSSRTTKSAMKNIVKNAGTKRGRKMMKDPTKAAVKALEKLSPEQIALLIKDLPKE